VSTSFMTPDELTQVGFRDLGEGVRISRFVRFYNPANISIGDYTRIDDFCILSAGEGGIRIGRNVHIACYVSIQGRAEIYIGDFAGLSSRTAVYSSNDDYSGEFMTNPTVGPPYTNILSEKVVIGRHVIVGAGSVILPGSVLEEGVAVGALSLVKGRLEAFGIYAGVPARFMKPRSRRLLELERRFLEELGDRRL